VADENSYHDNMFGTSNSDSNTDPNHSSIPNADNPVPGPNPGTYDHPDHAPANGYDNNTPAGPPVNAPGGNDYTGWNWEQILNGRNRTR